MAIGHPGWGGRRPGAGRPRKPKLLLPDLPRTDDPMQFLLAIVNHPKAPTRLRLEAAAALLPYMYKRAAPTEG